MQKKLKENEQDTGDEKSCDGSVQKGKQIKIDFNALMRAKDRQRKSKRACIDNAGTSGRNTVKKTSRGRRTKVVDQTGRKGGVNVRLLMLIRKDKKS